MNREETILKNTVTTHDSDDAAIDVPANTSNSVSSVSLDQSFRNQIQAIDHYRKMAEVFDVDNAISDVVNEFITIDDSGRPVDIVLDDADFSESIKKKIREEFLEVLNLLSFSTKGYELVKKWYVDGMLYFHIIVDDKNKKNGILKVNPLDPKKTKLVREVERERNPATGVENIKSFKEYYVYSDEFYTNKYKQSNMARTQNQSLMLNKDSVCFVHSGIIDVENNLIRSNLHKAIKPLNQLTSVEDALVIYRLSRAPERRLFYVDVGSLGKTKAEEYLEGLMRKYRSKIVYDSKSGTVKSNSQNMSMLEDIWLPRREGGKGTEVSTLPGGQNLGEMDDVVYFQKRLYKALNVPMSRMEGDSSFGLGKQAEITRDEIKFSKFISRLRVRFNELFYNLLKTQLILKNIVTQREWEEQCNEIRFDYKQDSWISEQQESDILRDRLDVLDQVENFVGRYVSIEWVYKNVLRLTEEEIKKIQDEIAAGKKTDSDDDEYLGPAFENVINTNIKED